MKFKSLLYLAFAFLILSQTVCFAFSNPFKKKYDKEKEEKQPMVHTVDEWLEEAASVKMDLRKREEAREYKNENDPNAENLLPPSSELPYYAERYNVKPGSKELDLTFLLKNKFVRSPFVSNPDFTEAVYSEVYYYPQTRQTASSLYLIELDGHLGKKERLKDVSVFEHTRYPLISTAVPYLKEGFFSTLTFVDFSSDGKKIIAKEKRGSNRFGIYETYVWVYFLTDENRELNSCYMNNLNFSNEMAAFYENVSDNENSFFGSTEDAGSFDFDFNKLQTVPDVNPDLSFVSDKDKNSNGNITGTVTTASNTVISGLGSKNGEFDTNSLRENAANSDNSSNAAGSNYGIKEEDVPKLDYKDVRNFIKTVWKEESMTSPVKSRWYNKIPVDFRVDTPYTPKKSKGFGVRLNMLNEMIKAYWFDRQNLILNHIRWNLKPLGFNKNNKDEIIVIAWAYNNNGEEISLGRWGVNLNDGLPRYIPDDEKVEVEANGFYLVRKLNP